MNLENYKLRFQKLIELVPEHEDLKRSFVYYTLFIAFRNIKWLYTAVTILENVERFVLTSE